MPRSTEGTAQTHARKFVGLQYVAARRLSSSAALRAPPMIPVWSAQACDEVERWVPHGLVHDKSALAGTSRQGPGLCFQQVAASATNNSGSRKLRSSIGIIFGVDAELAQKRPACFAAQSHDQPHGFLVHALAVR